MAALGKLLWRCKGRLVEAVGRCRDMEVGGVDTRRGDAALEVMCALCDVLLTRLDDVAFVHLGGHEAGGEDGGGAAGEGGGGTGRQGGGGGDAKASVGVRIRRVAVGACACKCGAEGGGGGARQRRQPAAVADGAGVWTAATSRGWRRWGEQRGAEQSSWALHLSTRA